MSYDSELDAMESECDEKHGRISKLKRDLAAKDRRIEALELEVSFLPQAEETIKTLRFRIEELEKDRDEARVFYERQLADGAGMMPRPQAGGEEN